MANPIIETTHDGDTIRWEITRDAAAGYVAAFGHVDNPRQLIEGIHKMLSGSKPGNTRLSRDHVDLWRADWRHYHVRLIAQPLADGNTLRLVNVLAPSEQWKPRAPKLAASRS